MATRRRSRRSYARRRKKTKRGGGLSCKALFEMKGNAKWKDVPKSSKWSRLRYSVCKRTHPHLYKTSKQNLRSTPSKESSQKGTVKTHGVLFDPTLRGKSSGYIELVNKTNSEVHTWLDQNGWTDKNLIKAERMRQQRLRGIS